ncbi:MAG TPA: GMC oxidoreductase [Burkholderiales bacterium]|nr:GMC oxidoreductase [Burkholderiales bacterium]
MTQAKLTRAELLLDAQYGDRTPFDFIVIGSGAGGGPLAARLARAGKRVLLIEAGRDPAVERACGGDPVVPEAFEEWRWREAYGVPGYHAAATEDPDMSWNFSVRHYERDEVQRGDPKYFSQHDPSATGGIGRGGILYPRSSALGGCTAHNAMIIVRPNDYDWDRIASLTGDESWRSERMQGYFSRIEKCKYEDVFREFIRNFWWRAGDLGLRVVKFVNPRSQLDRAGHGRSGWQATSFVSPALLLSILRTDRIFRRLLIIVGKTVLGDRRLQWWWRQAIFSLDVAKALDANDLNKRRQSPDGINLVPIATDGVRRSGVREWLLQTARDYPDHLVIETGIFARRILLANDGQGTPPRAHGVEVVRGAGIYRAGVSPQVPGESLNYFAREEVIVCAGAFNSPQLLMLSGIGDPGHLKERGIAGIGDANGVVGGVVALPGVGRNLQDRYEISVVSELDEEFPCLQGASFQPNDASDPIAREWRRMGEGLYTTNGGALAILLDSKVSQALREEMRSIPDLLILGFPAAFRGYYWGWSRELLKASGNAAKETRNLWSWVILKAYTSNVGGVVRLRTADALDQPEINFNSFGDGHEDDLRALVHAVKYVRRLNASRGSPINHEKQPGEDLRNDSGELEDWIRREAWGHHACGTCRIGSQPWQADAGKVEDMAVVDSKFRVHGVKGLRVVDASVFPQIPGYFICSAVFMIGEKAADTIIADCAKYPHELRCLEARALSDRRKAARLPGSGADGTSGNDRDYASCGLPPQAVGLALSGGGIRSGTFSLGVLQALAQKDRLRRIDFMSTVSGGGFSGGFVGRLFTRLLGGAAAGTPDKVGYVQKVLADINSPEMWWLRRHANYILAGGRPEIYLDLGIFWRNFIALHFTIAMLFLGVFGMFRGFADWRWGNGTVIVPDQVVLSPWWRLPVLILAFAVVPYSLSFWLTPKADTKGPYSLFPLLGWIVLLAGAVVVAVIPSLTFWAMAAVVMLLLAWVLQEVARFRVSHGTWLEPLAKSIVVRNQITRCLGLFLFFLACAALWVLLDTWARITASVGWGQIVAATVALLSTVLPVFNTLVTRLLPMDKSSQPVWPGNLLGGLAIGAIAYAMLAVLLFSIDTMVHWAFNHDEKFGLCVMLIGLIFSLAIRHAFDVLNRSSLQSAYGERVSRAFLGAANAARTHPNAGEISVDILVADPGDDLPMDRYHPEQAGGPLHLINVCVNETADAISGRRLPEDHGLPMCVGPLGVSVGLRFHSVWESAAGSGIGNWFRWLAAFNAPAGSDSREIVLRALPVGPDPDAFHVLGRKDHLPARVEPLRLSQWLGISAAALTTGLGRRTRMPLSLLLGLLNIRLGYWWDSGIQADHRSDRYPPSFLRRLWSFPGWLFKVQGKILNEWRGYFAGPSERYWYLTDGGHFENLGLYELLRRKLPFIIAVDATEDDKYEFDNLAILTRQARIDFAAELSWAEPSPERSAGKIGWRAVEATIRAPVPQWIRDWIDPDAIGGIAEFRRSGSHAAALAGITYGDSQSPESWLLLIKPVAVRDQPLLDVRSYAKQNKSFPNEPTANPLFDDDQWESYRALGQLLGRRIFRD